MTQPVTQPPTGATPQTDPQGTPSTATLADPPSSGGTVDTAALGDPGKKALAAEREARKAAEKERAALAAKLKEIEDRDKTEAQKLAEAQTAAEKRAAEAEARLVRLEVAHAKGLTPAQAKRLVGATREELEADADELLETFKSAATPGIPKPDPTQGARGAGPTVDARIADAQARAAKTTSQAERQKIARELIALQNEKLRNQAQR